jgi:hypothetical protein
MNKILLFLCVVFFSCFKAGTNDGTELLKKTIAYHDPKGNWSKFKARLYFASTDSKGKEKNFELEMDNKTGYFCYITRQDGKEIVKGIMNGAAFFLIDGKKDLTEEERKIYKLTSENVKGTRDFYGYLYGLPMKLTDKGTIVDETVRNEQLNGQSYPTLRVSYDAAVGKDNWFFYLDPKTSAMRGYRFNHGKPETGEYILLEDELTVNGVKLPKVRKWYFNKDDKFLATDNLVKAEKLTSYRF